MLRLAAPTWALLLCAAFASVILFDRLPRQDLYQQDIHTIWLEGKRLSQGADPYARTLRSDPRSDAAQYPAYFPGSYLAIAALCRLGIAWHFEDWLRVWQPVCAVFYFLIAALLISQLCEEGDWTVGCFAAAFWLLNRWTLFDLGIAHLDIPALFFLLLSLRLFPSRRRASLLSLGLSLAIKQIAVFLVPFYLVWTFAEQPRPGWAAAARALAWISLVPAALSAPFFFAAPAAFTKSLLFSLTRQSAFDFPLNALLGPGALAERLPLLLMVAFAAAIAARGYIRPFAAALLGILIFLDLNPVLFGQYFVWAVPLVPLALFERGEVRGRPGGTLPPLAAAACAVLLLLGSVSILARAMPPPSSASDQPPALETLKNALILDPSDANRRAYYDAVYGRDAAKFWVSPGPPGQVTQPGACFVAPRLYDALMAWRGGEAARAGYDLSALARDWRASVPGPLPLTRVPCAEIASLCRGHTAQLLAPAARWPRVERDRLRRELALAGCAPFH